MDPRVEASIISQYLSDESNAFIASPDGVSGVFFPECESDIVQIVKSAIQSGETITVSGAGTGLTGSRVPMHGGIVMSMERMLRSGKREGCRELKRNGLAGDILVHLDNERGLAHVAPGISLSEMDATLPKNWGYPPDPTERLASLGGTVATNASGARCFNYGPTRAWIDGLRVVLADGEVLDIRRGECFADENDILAFSSESGKGYRVKIPNYIMPDVKNAAGLYSKKRMDLIDLFIGSEGILGIFSEITIRVQPTETKIVSDLAFFGSLDDALGLVDELRGMKAHGILAIEYFDGNALDFIRDQYPEIPECAEAAILIELDGGRMEMLSKLDRILKSHNSVEDWCANNSVDRREMKEFRHSLPDSINAYLKQHGSYKMGTDFAVPAAGFRGMMDRYREAGKRFEEWFPREGSHCVTYGHVGDCHAHFNFITVSDEERRFARELYTELALLAISLSGTISAEHGCGKKSLPVNGAERRYVELMYGETGMREIARVKAELDPQSVLNPGNMVPVKND